MSSNFTKRAKQIRAENALSGTITVAANTLNVVGIGTKFTTEIGVGNVNRYVWINGGIYLLASVTDDTHAILDASYSQTSLYAVGVTNVSMIVTAAPLYTVALGVNVGILHSLFVSNNNTSSSRKFIIRIYDNTTQSWVVLAPSIEIPINNAYSHPKPINLLTSDLIHIAAVGGVDFDLHVYSSIVEKTS